MMTTAMIIAAGKGTRMRSPLPDSLHALGGKPVIWHLLEACEEVFDRIAVVVGPGMEAVARAVAPHQVVVQHDPFGTAHAALQAIPLLGKGDAAVLSAARPLVRAGTLRALLARRARGDARLALLVMRPSAPTGSGRLFADGNVRRAIDWPDAGEDERATGLFDVGGICADSSDLSRWLRAVRNDNSRSDYRLADVVGMAVSEGAGIAAVEGSEAELRSIDSHEDLFAAERDLAAMRQTI